LLCVMRKTNKEHLTAIQILTKKLRCRQSDIGFAGIKDMRAVTYQFLTLRNTTLQRMERAIRNHRLGPGQSDIELKILCSNADSVLNIGSLEGNRFEITVRNLKRVVVGGKIVDGKIVDGKIVDDSDNDNGTTRGDSFVSCDVAHIDRMVERIRTHGFVNFYGEQRIGAPGTRELVGVRAFEIGRAMLKNDFRGAINLLMEGSSSTLRPNKPEPEAVRRIRSAWRDSNGDPSVTLKAFHKDDVLPRERAVLRGLNRYPDNPLEALRFLSFHTRIFYINAYQSYVFNKAASERIKRFGNAVAKGDLYLDDGDGDGDGDDDDRERWAHRLVEARTQIWGKAAPGGAGVAAAAQPQADTLTEGVASIDLLGDGTAFSSTTTTTTSMTTTSMTATTTTTTSDHNDNDIEEIDFFAPVATIDGAEATQSVPTNSSADPFDDLIKF